jgi:hypothetical protein
VIKERSSIVLLFIGIFSIGIVNIVLDENVYGHNFVSDEKAMFLTQVYKAEIELILAINNFPSNVSLATNHAERAAFVMDDIYDTEGDITEDTDFIRKYDEAMNSFNSTFYAMVLANIADEILRNYGESYDLDYDLTNMSNMMMVMNSDTNSSSSNMNMQTMQQHFDMTEKNNSSPLVNVDEYQSAKQLSEKAYEIFKTNLKPLSIHDNMTNTNNNNTVIANLEQSLVEIKDLMMMNNNNDSASELMQIVHGKIHPILQAEYNLPLKKQ